MWTLAIIFTYVGLFRQHDRLQYISYYADIRERVTLPSLSKDSPGSQSGTLRGRRPVEVFFSPFEGQPGNDVLGN